jgi:hypothetical protein
MTEKFSRFQGTANGANLPAGNVSTADGFIDIDLPIEKAESNSQCLVSVIARGTVEGANVGFAFELDTKWDEKPVDSMNLTLYWGKACIHSIGADSDAFLKLLADRYQLELAAANMRLHIEVAVVGLANDPRLVQSNPTKMKVFFNANTDRNYAEVFLNLDLNAKVLEFHEKDPEYRAPLLRALSGEP